MGIEGAAPPSPPLLPLEKKVWLWHRVGALSNLLHPVPGYRGWNGKLLRQRGLGASAARVVAWVVAETPSGRGGGGGAFNKRQQFRKMPEVCKFIAGNVIYQIRCRHSPTRRGWQRSQLQRQRRQRSAAAGSELCGVALINVEFIFEFGQL